MTNKNLKKQVSIRPFPFPYKAGLALCSDIDGCDKKTFIQAHQTLNSDKTGLGLPVADSFFGTGQNPEQLAYFCPDGATRSKDADFIKQAILHGLVDSLHSWGDFNNHPPEPGFIRPMAKKLCNDLNKHKIKIPVWINHGTPDNHQNFMARLQPGYQGDNPSSSCYTADIANQLGVKFFWWSELVAWPLSANKNQKAGHLFRLSVNAAKNLAKTAFLKKNFKRSAIQLTELALPVTLRDGQKVFGFTRFSQHRDGIWTLPTRHTLRHSLCSQVLDNLIKREGYLIIYSHLGLPKPGPEPLFPIKDYMALLDLANRFDKGDIWVAPTSHLLFHWLLVRYLEWDIFEQGENLVIHIQSINDPVSGPRTPKPVDLAGLSFYTPRPEHTIFRIGGKDIRPQAYGSDHTKKPCAGFPPLPAPNIELFA